MEVICSFQKPFGGVCASEKRYERAVVVPVLSREREVSGHTQSVGISDVQSEVELILARVRRTGGPRDHDLEHLPRPSLRGDNQCRVPPRPKHASKGKLTKAYRGRRGPRPFLAVRRVSVDSVPIGWPLTNEN